MSIKEILEELPKLTPEEKRQLWNVLNHEMAHDVEEEPPEVLAAIDEGIRSLESGERTYTIEEARQVVAETVAKARW
jgi:hypothetical protein